ncbi:M23 family metallopeptidase [Microbacterium sp. CFBP9034]|uniref:M23 family metallopeptidase n=1 Tax=Microbacterium sp. CFBP9034 TaxID=3096540 RepID=UPI002A6B8174|nr:M23 family metallopeptidase [Microbacterium sp. CFBP9034]MDY0909177.1 M23 family metallopeptidase [Microbacterium sp. CFBP9034]
MRSIRAFLLTALTVTALTLGGLAPAASAALATTAPAALPAATTFAKPLVAKTYTVSSFFGPRCIPLPGASTYHLGVDLAAKAGSPIYAIAAGLVTATVDGTASRAGYIAVRHSIGGVEHTSKYLHIWSSTTRVKVGQTVTAGQRISEVGTSGGSSGNHLHLEIWKGSAAQDPAVFLKARGVDLYAAATAVNARVTPATCTYYATAGLNLRTGPSTSYTAIRLLPKATAMVHVPGQITAGFIPVKVGTQSGWVSSSYVSPVKPAVPAPTVVPPPTYATTAPLNLRVSPSTTAARILIIPKGANVGVIKASSGVWRQVTYAGKTGWVHSAYLVRR